LPFSALRSSGVRDHVRHNREFWDRDADDYQAVHGDALTRRPLAWGAFRAPESELHALGDVAGKRMLELGCGAGQWSIALDGRGAQCIGLDLSRVQLRHAREQAATLPLVNANGEQLPFADASFDIVFCDHGALSFCDPARIVPEVARVLRPGGSLTFCASTPLLYLTWNAKKEKQSRRLHTTYDDLGQMPFDDGTIDWVLPPGEWIRVLHANELAVEDLVELRPPADATTTYGFAPLEWARRWPAEWIWRARRR
jgi:SAM-dependent methyltransferase